MRFLRRFRRARSIRSSDANIAAKPVAISTGASDHELEKSEARFGFGETVCGWAVVVGVCLEYGPKFMVFVYDRTWENFRSLSGGLLIALGVVGEIICASFAASKRDKLRNRAGLRIAEVNLRAEQEHAARLTIEADLLRLRARYSNRRLTPEQQADLRSKLSAFADAPVQIRLFNSDSEMEDLAEDLRSVMPGRTEVDMCMATIGFSGIQIVVTQDAVFADPLVSALMDSGLGAVVGPIPEPDRGTWLIGGGVTIDPPPAILIAIGRKP